MTSPADEPDRSAADPAAAQQPAAEQPAEPTKPLWWVLVPSLVALYGAYQLAQGDTGGIWPWNAVLLLVAGLALLAFVLADRRR